MTKTPTVSSLDDLQTTYLREYSTTLAGGTPCTDDGNAGDIAAIAIAQYDAKAMLPPRHRDALKAYLDGTLHGHAEAPCA